MFFYEGVNMETILMFMKTKKKEFILTAIMATIGAILSIVPFALIYKLISVFLEKGTNIEIEVISSLLLSALGIFVLKYFFTISSFVFSHIAAFDLLYQIRTKLTSHLGKLPMGFWTKNSSGKVRKIIQEDVERIELFVAHHLPDTISGTILPIAAITFLFFIHWKMALVTLIPLPIGFILVKLMFSGIAMGGTSREQLWEDYHKSIEKMHSTIVEFVEGMPVVKAFNITANSFQRLRNSVFKYRDFTVQMSKSQTPFYAFFTAMTIGGGLFIIPFGLHFLKTDQIDIPTFLMFLTLGTGCFHQFVKVMMITGHMELIFAGGRRIGSILDEKILEEPQTPVIPKSKDIKIKNLNFQYDKDGKQILKNINVIIPEKSFTAIVGPSGSGKSTLVNLIARMWETDKNQITIGNKSLNEIGTVGINKIVGTVFQDVEILTDTVANNIRMDNTKASIIEIVKAAKAANCHDFIENLPFGYDTVIGDGGEIHLSGGEKQRISLARVVLKDPDIVLLDEASCYADAENEVKIQEAFSRLMQNKTVVVIAHRLSTIVKADNILVVDDGKIVEQGSHDALLKINGLYAKMWNVHTRANDWKLS
jgi:ATP-binding cassette subfamily B protein